MKVAVLVAVVLWFVRSRSKGGAPQKGTLSETPASNAIASKAPDFEKPEQFLWYLMFGANDGRQSMTLKLVAAVVFFGGQLALEFLKASK